MRRKHASNPDLDTWFKLPDTPMKNSPVGRMIQAIVDESPQIAYQDARNMALTSLANASKRKNYRVFTPKQEAENKARADRAFRRG